MKRGVARNPDAAWINTWAMICRHLLSQIAEIEKDRNIIADRARAKIGLASEFTKLCVEARWWRYYEMGESRHFALAMFHIGLIPDMVRTTMGALRLRSFLPLLQTKLEDKEVKPSNPRRALGATWSLGNSLRAYLVCGEPLNALIRRAENDQDALGLCLHVDPLTIYCKPIQRRFVRAVAEHDTSFLTWIGEAMKPPKMVIDVQYPELRACLYLLHRAKQLAYVNEALAEQLFLVKLADIVHYDSDRRTLIKYIQRYRASKATPKR